MLKYLEGVQEPLLGDGVEALGAPTMVPEPYIVARKAFQVSFLQLGHELDVAYNRDKVGVSQPTATCFASLLTIGRSVTFISGRGASEAVEVTNNRRWGSTSRGELAATLCGGSQ